MTVPEGGDTTIASSKPEELVGSGVSSINSTGYSRRASIIQGLRRRRTPLVIIGILLIALKLYIPPVYQLLSGPVVVTRYDRRFGETKATVGPDQEGWISTNKISKHLLHAIIAAEDGRFYEHHGLDFDQMLKSYQVNRQKKRYVRGASTISQQVVKMAFLGREKTLLRKSREAVGAVLMELILPKDKILEWYINLVEFGDGVYGIREGCWHYFKTKPELLTVDQSVHLALVLPSPNAWSRGLRRRALTNFGQRRFVAILNTMRNMGFITKAQWTDAVTRGDFGRPLAGYAKLMTVPEAAEAEATADEVPSKPEAKAEGQGEAEAKSPPPPQKPAASQGEDSDDDQTIPEQGQESDP